MAVFSPTNAKVHFKAYDGNFTDTLGNATITQHNSVSMASTQTLFGQESMYMSNFNQAVSFDDPSLFDVGTGDYTVGFWFYPTQFTSWDRLFVTDPYQNASPLRIYNHNGSINVYAESTTDGTNTHDYMMGYYLGNLSGVNNWYHIMVKRDSGTTKLYINGVERSSSTMSYSIANSNTVVLGADTDRGMTGVKGYIQDFFWTEDAVSFTQADFTPATAEPITFHSGNPSISSFSTSAANVAESGDSVNLLWTAGVAGETKLELLKYVGGLLSSTEDVLGLYSKSVTITETVSYKLRATNDNGSVDSASVEITLNGGSNSMAIGNNENNLGLVIQKDMVRSKSELAGAMKVNGGGVLDDVLLNDALGKVLSQDASIVVKLSEDLSSNASVDLSSRVLLSGTMLDADQSHRAVLDAADVSLTTRVGNEETRAGLAEASVALSGAVADQAAAAVNLAARVLLSGTMLAADQSHRAAITEEFSSADSAEASSRTSGDLSLTTALASEETARGNADGSLTTRLGEEETARGNADSSIVVKMSEDLSSNASVDLLARQAIQADVDANEVASDAAEASLTTRLGEEETARGNADSSVVTRFSTADSVEASSRTSGDLSLTTRLASEETARGAADSSIVVKMSEDLSSNASVDLLARQAIQADVDANEVASDAAEASLTTRLGEEETARGNADSSIVVKMSEDLSSNASVDLLARQAIQADVDANEVASDAAEASLTTRLGEEETARGNADSSVVTRFSTADSVEASSRTSGDLSLTTRLSTEESVRASADASLAVQIDAIDDVIWSEGNFTLSIGDHVKLVFEDYSAFNADQAIQMEIKYDHE